MLQVKFDFLLNFDLTNKVILNFLLFRSGNRRYEYTYVDWLGYSFQ